MREDYGAENLNKPIPSPEAQGLSPEVLNLVMAKVQSIDTEGVGFHSILGDHKGKEDKESVKQVLKDGLLGGPWADNKGLWASMARTQRKGPLWFNIVGRASDGGSVAEARWSRYKKFTILFNLDSFQEVKVPSGRALKEAKKKDVSTASFAHLQSHEYSADPDGLWRGEKDPNSNWGFILQYRVAPRFFTGVVLGPGSSDGQTRNLAGDFNEKDLEELIGTMMAADKDNPGLLLPIYDLRGNLLWPQSMSYEEVKKKVEENKK